MLVLLVIVVGLVVGYVLGTRAAEPTDTALPCEGAASARPGGLVKNGGFETPVVPRGSWVSFTPGERFPGWRVIGAPGNVSPLSGEFASGRITWTPHSGKQTLDLTGTTETATGVSQTIRTKSGRDYGLSFWTGNSYAGVGALYGTTTTTKVLVDGKTVLVAHNNSGAGQTTLGWKHFCVPFSAKSGATKIAFVNGDVGKDNSDILDDVTVR